MNRFTEFKTAEDAWRYAILTIENNGVNVLTEDNQLTREVRNLILTITSPNANWPIKDAGWDLPALNIYANQLLSGDNPTDFEYTYGERFRYWPTWDQWHDGGESGYVMFDQIDDVIRILSEYPTSRRAVMTTWRPGHDGGHGRHSPCLMTVDFLLRDGALGLSAMFRSHDIKQAWPANVYGLNKLLEYVAASVGVVPGSITTWSVSAHYYIE